MMSQSPPHDPFLSLREKFLPAILEKISEITERHVPDGSGLPEMVSYHFSTGGKRLRAILPLRLAELSGEDPARLVSFAASCEMLHNATLVHDDLQDGDETRRNQPTVWKKFGPASAINCGDAMFYYTLLFPLLDDDASLEEKVALTQLIIRYTLEVIDGQEREFRLQQVEYPEWEAYLNMVKGKTSGLFALPIVGAAQRLRLPTSTIQELERGAQWLGILFQIQDDLLDIYGEKGRDTRCADLREGKLSSLIIYTIQSLRASGAEEEASWLRTLMRAERHRVTEEEIDRVLELFREEGTKEGLLETISDYQRRAEAAVTDPLYREFIVTVAELFCRPIKGL